MRYLVLYMQFHVIVPCAASPARPTKQIFA